MPPGLMKQVPVSQSGTHLKIEKREDVGVNHEDAFKCINDDHATYDQQVMRWLSRSNLLTKGGTQVLVEECRPACRCNEVT